MFTRAWTGFGPRNEPGVRVCIPVDATSVSIAVALVSGAIVVAGNPTHHRRAVAQGHRVSTSCVDRVHDPEARVCVLGLARSNARRVVAVLADRFEHNSLSCGRWAGAVA